MSFQKRRGFTTGYCWLRRVALYGVLLILLMICRFSWPSDEAANAEAQSKKEWYARYASLGETVSYEGEEIWPLLDLAVDSKGFRYMVFHYNRWDLFEYHYQRAVRKWRTGVYGSDFLEDAAGKKARAEVHRYPSIAIRLDQHDRPHILWSRSKLHYMTAKGKYPERDGWIHSVVPLEDYEDEIFPRFAVSSDGTPYVLYFGWEEGGRDVKFASMQEGKWKIESLGIKFEPASTILYDITVGKDDEIIVAVCYRKEYPNGDHRLVLLTKSEDEWAREEIGTLDSLTNYPENIKVLVDPEGNPHIFYFNEDVLEKNREDYAIYEQYFLKENKWQREAIVRSRPGMVVLPEAFSVDISPDGKIFVCYADMATGLYLVEKKGDKWQEHLLDEIKKIIKTSIAAVNSSEVAIAFLSKSRLLEGLSQIDYKRAKSE